MALTLKAKYENTQEQLEKLIRNGGDPLTGELRVYSGVDLAIQTHSAADDTAIVTVAVYPDDTRHILNVESGKWGGSEIINKLINTHDRYHSILVVENNAGQDWIRQFTQEKKAIPIIPFTTGRNKANPEFGVESIFAELAAGKWIIPNKGGLLDPEIDKLVHEMLFYNPKDHTGDRLMALWFATIGIKRHQKTTTKDINVRTFGRGSRSRRNRRGRR